MTVEREGDRNDADARKCHLHAIGALSAVGRCRRPRRAVWVKVVEHVRSH